MGPDLLVAYRVVRIATHEKVLEESHVLQAEERDLVVRLVHDLRGRGILALESRLLAVTTRGMRLLTLDAVSAMGAGSQTWSAIYLDTSAFTVEAAPPTFRVPSSLESLLLALGLAQRRALHQVAAAALPRRGGDGRRRLLRAPRVGQGRA